MKDSQSTEKGLSHLPKHGTMERAGYPRMRGRPSHLPEDDLLHEVEANGVRAVGADQRYRVQHVAQGLAHLEAILGEEAVTEHLGGGVGGQGQSYGVQHIAQGLAHLETVLGEEAMTKHLGRGERERAGE